MRLHKHNFDKLFVFCGLGAISGDYDWATKIFQLDDIKSISKIMNMQEQLWRKGLQYNVMIIFDDFVGTLSMIGGKGGKLIDKLISSGRHIGISVAFLTQKLTKFVSPLVRTNCRYWFITHLDQNSITGVVNEQQSEYQDKFSLWKDYSRHIKKYESMDQC